VNRTCVLVVFLHPDVKKSHLKNSQNASHEIIREDRPVKYSYIGRTEHKFRLKIQRTEDRNTLYIEVYPLALSRSLSLSASDRREKKNKLQRERS